jgi:hypothetical protein
MICGILTWKVIIFDPSQGVKSEPRAGQSTSPPLISVISGVWHKIPDSGDPAFERLKALFVKTGAHTTIESRFGQTGNFHVHNSELNLKAVFIWPEKVEEWESVVCSVLSETIQPISFLLHDPSAEMYYFHKSLAPTRGVDLKPPREIGHHSTVKFYIKPQ